MKDLLKNLYKALYNEELVRTEIITQCPIPEITPKTNREKLFDTAFSCLNTDASPKDYASDEYGCMETVDEIYNKCFGHYIDPTAKKPIISTNIGYKYLLSSNSFIKALEPMYGDIIISPTGYGKNWNMPNGHIGILGKNNIIMSNSSETGKFEENYTTTLWKRRYQEEGGYPIIYFRVL